MQIWMRLGAARHSFRDAVHLSTRSQTGLPIKRSLQASLILAFCLLLCLSQLANAGPDLSDSAVNALRGYAQLLNTEAPKLVQQEDSRIAVFSDLRDFAQRIGVDASSVQKGVDEGLSTYVKLAANKPKAPAAAAASGEKEATYVGTQACLGCHANQAAKFNQTLMGKIFRNPRDVREKAGCEGCHGPGSLHVSAGGGRGAGGIFSFRLDDKTHTAEEFNAVCLSCHEKGPLILWPGSEHEVRSLACVNCHTVMRNITPKHQLAQLTVIDTCSQCHKKQRSDIWQSSHMPIREGKITCSSCHNPHGSYGDKLLKTATVNDTCYRCHAEKRGPFLWEHPPVRESCLNCHNPHGSINDSLLKVSRPRLCQQCHTAADHPGNPGNPLAIYYIGASCSNCHVKIHGSNSPAGSQFVR